MPSTYTSNLGIELPADGEQDGIWGDVVNDNMSILDRAINGSLVLSLSGTSSTLTTSDGTLSNGQYKALILGGSPSGTHTITISPNDAQKIYFVRNTTAQSVVFTQGSGGNVTIATGDSGIIYADGGGSGAAVANLTDHFAMSSVRITGGTITGITDLAVADGGTGASDASTARTNLGLVIGTNVQAWDANLDQIAALAPTADNFIVGNGSAWTLETPANALLSLGVTATAAELNTLDGITATTAELNFTDGVTSNIQTQLNAKQPLDADLTAIAALAVTDGNFIVGNGTTWVVESGATARTSLGLGSIATQESSSVSITGGSITGITDLAVADGGTGASTAADARTNLGLGTMATQASSSVTITGGSVTGITDIAIADGGTGASTAAQALINLGLTATAAELNYSDGVTSNIQTQLNSRVTSDADDTLTGGYTTTADNDGTISSGTYTPTPSGGNMKRIVNGGAFTLAAPSAAGDYTLVVQITNSASAGTITLSGFNRTAGSPFTTTSGHDFFVYITKCNGFTFANVVALQ
jgi:hypothetical protein